MIYMKEYIGDISSEQEGWYSWWVEFTDLRLLYELLLMKY